MFKFVLLSAILAAVAAKPSGLFSLPITQYSTIVSPVTTTFAKQESSVIHPSPIGYYPGAPLVYSHFIKKRSPQFPFGYIAPSTYIASTPYIAPSSYIASSPLIQNTHILPAVAPITPAVHLIKKRSAPLLPTTYILPQAYPAVHTPIVSTYHSAPFIPSTKLISQPFFYSQFIKK